MKRKFNGGKFLDDLLETGGKGVRATGYFLSFFGIEYLSQGIYGTSVANLISEDADLFSKEGAVYFTQLCLALGTAFEGISFAVNTVAIPFKLLSGKYMKKIKPSYSTEAAQTSAITPE